MIRTKDLHIGYDSSLLRVNDLNLEQGKVYILIGRNGSGKSTFLKTISGQLNPVSGDLSISNRSFASIPVHERPKQVSFVQTHFPRVEYLRVKEYIGLARNPYTNFFGTLKQTDKSKAQEALTTLNINYLADRFTSELSDGEKQLVSIAKSLAQETSLIVLDEPTAFLDYRNKQHVLEYLIEIARKLNKLIVLSSHDLELSMEHQCDFLVINDSDETLEFAPHGISKEQLIEKAF